eukprot:6199368-Pleurochrysis_carterae.AAC.1
MAYANWDRLVAARAGTGSGDADRTLENRSFGQYRTCCCRQRMTYLAVWEAVYFPRGPSLACNQSTVARVHDQSVGNYSN